MLRRGFRAFSDAILSIPVHPGPLPPASDFPRGPLALLLVLAILALLANPRRRRVLRPALLVGGLILLAGCGSSGGGGANTNTGTPAGTYTVTIHATSGAQTATTTVSVVVH